MSMISINYQIKNKNTLRTLEKNVKLLTDGYVSVGIHRGVLTKRARGKVGGQSMAEIARDNELGNSKRKIPSRPFMMLTMRYHREQMLELMQTLGYLIIERRTTPLRALNIIGLIYASLLQQTIRNRVPPPNAPYTVARKGSSTPLIDTGQMIQSIRHVVVRR